MGSTSASSPTTSGGRGGEPAPAGGALGFAPERIAVARQVHGAELITHTGPTWLRSSFAARGPDSRDPRGRRPRHRRAGAAALVFVADCVPVALSGPGGVAMLHCGWRGLAAGSSAAGARGRRDRRRDRPRDRPLLLRGGDEVLAAFVGSATVSRRRHARPARGRAALLLEAGVERIEPRPLHQLRARALLLAPPRRGRTGRQAAWSGARRRRADVPGLIHGLDPAKIAANLGGPASSPGPGSRSSPRPSTCRWRRWERWPRPAFASSARTASRTSSPSTSAGATPSSGTSSATCRAARSSSCCRSAA